MSVSKSLPVATKRYCNVCNRTRRFIDGVCTSEHTLDSIYDQKGLIKSLTRKQKKRQLAAEMQKRWVSGLSFADIGRQMGYSREYVRVLLKEILGITGNISTANTHIPTDRE